MDLAEAFATLAQLQTGGLRSRIQTLEASVQGAQREAIPDRLVAGGVSPSALFAALSLKRAVGELNVVIHALGILLTLPRILEEDERIEYVSLGAGNTGRKFDLETDRRVAEFKFISWKGGAEAIRQNGIFKDFFYLAEYATEKRKELYVVADYYPLKFLNGGRALSSVTKDKRLASTFHAMFGERFPTVRDYYATRREEVIVVDLARLAPDLFGTFEAIPEVGLDE